MIASHTCVALVVVIAVSRGKGEMGESVGFVTSKRLVSDCANYHRTYGARDIDRWKATCTCAIVCVLKNSRAGKGQVFFPSSILTNDCNGDCNEDTIAECNCKEESHLVTQITTADVTRWSHR